MYHIGIDLGGTKIEGVVLDHKYNILKRRRVQTPDSYVRILSTIQDIIHDIDLGGHTIGVGTPGVAGPAGRMLGSNLRYIRSRYLKRDLEDALNTTISMSNDADCFVSAEATLGAGAKYNMVFGVIMGTGVGGGISIGGSVISGSKGMAGEWGHSILHPNGVSCWCGKRGCVEAYISGPALQRAWYEKSGTRMNIPDIIEQQLPGYEEWRHKFVNNFGLALSNVIQILNPDCVVLGGGLSNIEFLYGMGSDIVGQLTPEHNTPIIQNSLGDSAGVVGAALLGATGVL
ncbi:MAG: ROK family protein [Cenarchaeum sp. SB0678_bin_8]|nr:ROK family protein [Cenarchaeum sp. SB0666_bin_15]MYD58401.1 ROK family protein [Cenarchaeum sp. SB0678_bin_8]MYJ27177.1 ROK family protein [Cenarchaeum sp. SB0672_bin_9]